MILKNILLSGIIGVMCVSTYFNIAQYTSIKQSEKKLHETEQKLEAVSVSVGNMNNADLANNPEFVEAISSLENRDAELFAQIQSILDVQKGLLIRFDEMSKVMIKNEKRITDLENQVSRLRIKISKIQDDITTLQRRADSGITRQELNVELAKILTSIDSFNGDIDSLVTRVTTIEDGANHK